MIRTRSHKRAQVARLVLALIFVVLVGLSAASQEANPNLYGAMRWRLIGPFRAGRVTAVAGVPGEGRTFYMGTPGGGVWKTTDAGQVWKPIFDQEQVASIGALALAPSDPNIVYVGTGEQNQGKGMYVSRDAGATWSNIGLEATHVITALAVDPHDPNIILVAAAGDSASGAERGVFKTTSGGKTWQKVLYQDNDTGVFDLSLDLSNPRVVYATLWHRTFGRPSQEGAQRPQDAAIYKSNDEGSTWAPVGGKGLPSEPMGRVGVAVAPGTQGNKIYAIVSQGFFRSDDGGATWNRSTTDPRILGNGYFSRVFVDPRHTDTVYVAQTSMYRSADGGRTFEAWQGAPSGDDYHVLWIDPLDTRNMIAGVDQGAIVSVNGGETWSSWYNQPTGQFYHVTTDEQFPYYVYAAQQDSGTAAVVSRSDYGEITYRDWAPAGGFEFSFIAPDPLNPNTVFIGGWYGSVLRFDKVTGQVTHVFVRTAKYRTAGMAPLAFSPQDAHTLYVGAQYVLKTTNGGVSWQEISPDLTEKAESGGRPEPPTSRVITTLAISPVKAGEIWAGTGNGLIQVTQDGKSWQNVTPPGLPPRSNVNAIEASPQDAATAYAVIDAFQDLHPLIYRTHDLGKTWQAITDGLPTSTIARVVRADPARKGLLYAGTETGAYVSWDDGDHWQTLQLNLPTSSVRDLAVHGDDLVAATYGRALWVLDDLAPLRQYDAKVAQAEAHLFRPPTAVRARWDMNQDTPLPVETPVGKNPPDGVILDYYLKSAAEDQVKLSIYDAQNNLVREYSDIPPFVDTAPANAPSYWFAPSPALSKTVGHNRFAWDLRYPEPKALRYSYYGNHTDYIEYTLADHAIPGETPRQQPLGPLVAPGEFFVVLSVGGRTYRQPLTVKPDPRVHVSRADLVQQLNTERSIAAQMSISYDGYDQATALRAEIAERQKALAGNTQTKDVTDALKALDEQQAGGQDGDLTELGMGPVNRELARLATMIESGDARPADPLLEGVRQSCQDLVKRLAQWREANSQNIPAVNILLKRYGLAPLPVVTGIPADPSCEP